MSTLLRIFVIAGIGVLVLAVAGTGYWGYQESQDKNAMLIKAENAYQRAFHNLNNNITNLEDELGKSLAMNSPRTIAPCMTNIWRIGYDAHSNIGQLPLNLTPFQKTESFLAEVAEFTYDIGMRDLNNEPLSDDEWGSLQALHEQAREIENDFQKLQSEVMSNNLYWLDVELEVAAEGKDGAKQTDQTIMDGFESLDKRVEGYIETEGSILQNKIDSQFRDVAAEIEGKPVSEEEAEQIAKQFLNVKDDVQAQVSANGEGREFTAYTIRLYADDPHKTVSVDVSRNGGHVLWMLDCRDIEETKISLHEAQQRATKFLEEHDIQAYEAVESDQYDHVGVFDFVRIQDGVRIYPDTIRIQVALDEGNIIGYEAVDHVVLQDQEWVIDEPSISVEEAKESVNGHFTVREEQLSLIELKAGEYTLCYELIGTVENETYRIFIDAQTGNEEKVEKMKRVRPIV